MSAKTTDPVVSPVSVEDLEAWLGDVSDPILAGLLLSATDAVIQRLQYDLEPREWTLTLWDWPLMGAKAWPNVGDPTSRLKREIDLPYAAIQSVESVEVFGQASTLFVTRDDSIVFNQGVPFDRYKENEDPAIVVEYTAGLATIPPSVTDAIKMLAAFLYEHRGECDVMDALKRSGADVMIQPYKKYAVVF